MIELLTAAPPLRRRSKNRIRTSSIGEYRFSFIHPAMGIVSIRNAVPSDLVVLHEALYKPFFGRHGSLFKRLSGGRPVGPSEQELIDGSGYSTTLLVTIPREEGEVIVAAVALFKADLLPDLRWALERSADDGCDTVRIERFAAFEYVAGFDRRPIVADKEALAKLLNNAKRKQGVILLVRNVMVDASFRKTDILKFISVKIVRILKYVNRCSHIIYENSHGGTYGCVDESGSGGSCRELLKGTEFGRRENIENSSIGTGPQDFLCVSSCETIFDVPPKPGRIRPVTCVTPQELSRGRRPAKAVV